MRDRPRPLVLAILDGWGMSERRDGNAIAIAETPTMDGLLRDYPWCRLEASGEAVGLMPGQMGDSNVGHLNLGAGRVVYQDVVRITRSIRSGDFFRNRVLLTAIEGAKSRGRNLHLMGLVSDGGVHSHLEHLYALLEMASAAEWAENTYVHAFFDGRDVPPESASRYASELERVLSRYRGNHGPGPRVAAVAGRYYAMDRDQRWERTKAAYEAMVLAEGPRASSVAAALRDASGRGETDEFVQPTVIVEEGCEPVTMGPGDSVVFFNFRADRARQISRALADPCFDRFHRRGGFVPLTLVGMTRYDESLPIPYAFPPQLLENTLGEVLARSGMRQLRLAETEKYAHVTFFFSGREEKPFPGESRRLVPSPKVPTYDQKPEMSAQEVTNEALKEIASGLYDVVVLNYANCDMVGHTGSLDAAVRAVETVDGCLGRVVKAALRAGGSVVVCADHGNAEQMVEEDSGEPHTAHTSNPVPCIFADERLRDLHVRGKLMVRDGVLGNVSPSILEILGLPKPGDMECGSLIEHREA